MILRVLPENHSLPVIQGMFYLTRVNNTGAAFGVFHGAGTALILVTLVSIAVLCIYLAQNHRKVSASQSWGWVLVIGGALGNLHDRLLYRYVIDFLDFRVWPVFNLADAFVCIGVFLVTLSAFRKN